MLFTPPNVWMNLDAGAVYRTIASLNLLEQRLVSLIQPFMTVLTLPHGQHALKGQVINFFNDIPSVQKTLPVPDEQSGFLYLFPHDTSKVVFPVNMISC